MAIPLKDFSGRRPVDAPSARRCTEELIAGHPMLRVDIPDGEAFTTRYYGSSAIYCLTVVSEAVGRKICSRLSQAPSFAWDLREHPKATIEYSSHAEEDELADAISRDCGGFGSSNMVRETAR